MNILMKNELQVMIEQIPPLINRYEIHDTGFMEAVKKWFKGVEELLKSDRVQQIGDLAALRGQITAAEDGVRDPTYIVEQGVRSSKIPSAVAAIALKRAQDILGMLLAPFNRRLEEAQDLIRKVIVISAQSGFLAPYCAPDGALTIPVADLWRHLTEVPSIREGLMRVLSLVSFEDAVVLMRETLDALPGWSWEKNLARPPTGNKSE